MKCACVFGETSKNNGVLCAAVHLNASPRKFSLFFIWPLSLWNKQQLNSRASVCSTQKSSAVFANLQLFHLLSPTFSHDFLIVLTLFLISFSCICSSKEVIGSFLQVTTFPFVVSSFLLYLRGLLTKAEAAPEKRSQNEQNEALSRVSVVPNIVLACYGKRRRS